MWKLTRLSAMRQLNLNYGTLYLNNTPRHWGANNGCLNMLPRMLGDGRQLRVVVPGQWIKSLAE